MSKELEAAALEYAARGWSVFPLHSIRNGECTCGNGCQSPGKHPRTKHGLKDASTDMGQIRQWWNLWPFSNVGVVTGETSGIVVLDIDGPEGKEALQKLGHTLPATCTAETGRGWHLVYRHPGGRVASSAEKIGPKIDVKADDAYIVAPPSLHVSGKRYEWIVGPDEAEPAAAPEWLTAATEKRTEPAPAVDGPIYPGNRNQTLTSLGGSMRRRGMGKAAIAAALLEENKRCQPPLPEDEVRRIAKSVARYPATDNALHSETRPEAADPFIDWPTFWDRTHDDAEWVFEGVLARGRSHAIYAQHKAGKSLLTLYAAAKLATGTDPVVVVYLDYEMTENDLLDRLEDMGYGPETDLSRLYYALLPSLPPLDTMEGAQALTKIIDRVQDEWEDHHLVLVLDTTTRAVAGEENSADTIRDFYRHTGVELKRREITYARLDHSGKDPTRGQRGSSSKNDDVDVVWRLTKTENGVMLTREASRVKWVPEKVTLGIAEEPLTFRPLITDWPAGTNEVAERLDALGVPLDAATRRAAATLKEAGEGRRTQVVMAALKWRRERNLEMGQT